MSLQYLLHSSSGGPGAWVESLGQRLMAIRIGTLITLYVAQVAATVG